MVRVKFVETGLQMFMNKRRKLRLAQLAVLMGAFSVILWAYEYGPNPGVCGVPGENGTCTATGCHTGTTNDSANKGSVSISFPNGLFYTPGVKQHLTVTVADPVSTQVVWGFETSARLANNPATMAGTFTPDDQYTQIMCSQSNLQVLNVQCLPGAGTQGCPVSSAAPACSATYPLQYMEHSYTGYVHTQGPGSGTYQFDWTPPATNVGKIIFYIAGNAGVGGAPNANGDHIYATQFTLAAGSAGTTPTVTSVATAGGLSTIAPNTYISLFGTNLSTVSDVWDSHIVNGALPTNLDGVTVNIGSVAAYVSYVSPTQINLLTPSNLGLGSVNVQVTNSNGASAAYPVTSQQYAPGFFQWLNNQPVATHADFSDAMANGTYTGLVTVPAKPGEYIILWGSGFGPTTPAAPAGTVVPSGSTTYYVNTVPALSLNGIPMPYYATALAPSFAGLYQAIAQVPASTPNGSWPVIATVGGISSPTGVVLPVHN